MRHRILALLAAATVGIAAGTSCVDFSGPRLDQNPNAPSATDINVQFVGMQGYQFANLTADNNRVISVWMRHMAGTGRQWLQYDAPYLNSENLFGDWLNFYANGGLIDIRGVQAKARARNDAVYLGVAQVWEALVMGTMADWWGAVPYADAVGSSLTPTYDTQRQVYARVQAVLDSAIANLAGAGPGPGSFDLVYGGDKARWTAAARTLKARYHLHESPVDPAALGRALAAAQGGIASPAGDLRTYQSSTEGEQNQWFQFRRQRGTDIGAGEWLVDLMIARGDPRLTRYFAVPRGEGAVRGAAPGEEDEGVSWLSPERADPGFRQPLVTWAETQLIVAEAQARGGQPGAALAALNAVRTDAGLPALVGLDGAALLEAIYEEKYVSLFQNPEVWDLYKRVCYPNFPLDNGASAIPLRLLYGARENAANRANVPANRDELGRNEVNPRVATAPDGSACLGQPE